MADTTLPGREAMPEGEYAALLARTILEGLQEEETDTSSKTTKVSTAEVEASGGTLVIDAVNAGGASTITMQNSGAGQVANVGLDGKLTAGTGLEATTGGVTAAAGNIVATAGAVTAGTTMTAGTGLTVTTGNLAVSAGNLTVSGTITAGGVATTMADGGLIANAAAIPVTGSAQYIVVTGAGAETNTLAIPTFVGQVICLFMETDGGGTRTVTVASAFNTAGNTTIALDDANNSITLLGIKKANVAGTLGWIVLANDGCTLG